MRLHLQLNVGIIGGRSVPTVGQTPASPLPAETFFHSQMTISTPGPFAEGCSGEEAKQLN